MSASMRLLLWLQTHAWVCRSQCMRLFLLVLVVWIAGCAPESGRVQANVTAATASTEQKTAGSVQPPTQPKKKRLGLYVPPISIIADDTPDEAIREPIIKPRGDLQTKLARIYDTDRLQLLSVPNNTQEIPPPTDSVWTKIRSGLKFPRTPYDRIRTEVEWYAKHQDYLNRVSDRARRYMPHIVAELERRQMPMDLALLPVVESAFQPFAYSHMGAAGLWQFMPTTGSVYGLKQNWWYEGRRDIVESTRAALDYLSKLHAQFKGDWLLAIAAYNTGEGNVSRAIRSNQRRNLATDFWSLKLHRETSAYVPRLLAIAELVSDPGKYKITLPEITTIPYFTTVELPGQIDLSLAAQAAGISLDEIYLLNPGYNRWATDPDGPHRLSIPLESATYFKRNLAKIPPQQRRQWVRHVVQGGDVLSKIAKRYNTTIATLQRLNGLPGTVIQIGSSLIIPQIALQTGSSGLSNTIRGHLQRAAERSGVQAIHRVRRGENLSVIAHRYKITVNQIAAWNGLNKNALLMPGKRLTILRRNRTPTAMNTAANSSQNPEKYRIQPGDTLWGIASRYSTSIQQLVLLNGISKNTVLQPGQILKVSEPTTVTASGDPQSPPNTVHYTVRSGDSLWRISKTFNVNIVLLRQWNRLPPDNALLYPGQQLLVYRTGT